MRSPAAWNLLAQRQEEGQDVRITRFMEQFTDLVTTMQKRLCSSDTVEEDAKEMQRQLLEVMTREELDELANQPVAETVRDLTPMNKQLVSSVIQQRRGNPLYNQRALEVEDLTNLMDSDFADRVLMPDADPTEQAEQDRQQQLEIMLLSSGQPVPVSPRDNHLMHLEILMPAAEQVGAQTMQGHFTADVLEAFVAHINEHYNQAIARGTKKEKLANIEEFLKKAGPAIAQLKEHDAAAAKIGQASQALAQGGAVPPGAPPPGQ
jgi:hypothetical protein